MPGQLLISDANILIDMEVGGLLHRMFRLNATFAVPNILFEEELRERHPELPRLGLKSLELSATSVDYADNLVEKYQAIGASINDLLALALAWQEQCSLLTGDAKLRTAAESEQVEFHGTLWLVEQMVEARVIVVRQADAAYRKMRDAGRRLPWDGLSLCGARFRLRLRRYPLAWRLKMARCLGSGCYTSVRIRTYQNGACRPG